MVYEASNSEKNKKTFLKAIRPEKTDRVEVDIDSYIKDVNPEEEIISYAKHYLHKRCHNFRNYTEAEISYVLTEVFRDVLYNGHFIGKWFDETTGILTDVNFSEVFKDVDYNNYIISIEFIDDDKYALVISNKKDKVEEFYTEVWDNFQTGEKFFPDLNTSTYLNKGSSDIDSCGIPIINVISILVSYLISQD